MLENHKYRKLLEILKPRIVVKSGSDMIDQGMIEEILEPIANVEVVGPEEFAGNIWFCHPTGYLQMATWHSNADYR